MQIYFQKKIPYIIYFVVFMLHQLGKGISLCCLSCKSFFVKPLHRSHAPPCLQAGRGAGPPSPQAGRRCYTSDGGTPSLQNILQELAGVGGFHFCDLLWRALRDDGAALVAAFRTKVDDVVGDFDDVEIVFDDENRVALVAERLEDFQQLLDVGDMEAGGRFVQYI